MDPTVQVLTTSQIYTATIPRIAAFASIDYRLSAHPDYPQNPSNTDPAHLRAAKHPDHIRDVHNGLSYLQHRFGFKERYVLVGHSCGATLAFQSVMKSLQPSFNWVPPMAILGNAGIYDLKLLRDTYKVNSMYQQLIEGAFGSDEDVWNAVSPAVAQGCDSVNEGWSIGLLAVLAHSEDDILVDHAQVEAMKIGLQRWVNINRQQRHVEVLFTEGGHDVAWRTGHELARAVAFTLEKLDHIEKSLDA